MEGQTGVQLVVDDDAKKEIAEVDQKVENIGGLIRDQYDLIAVAQRKINLLEQERGSLMSVRTDIVRRCVQVSDEALYPADNSGEGQEG